MSEIREACVKRDRPNGAAAKAGIGQKAAGQFQTPRQTRIPRRSLLLSQKPIDVPGRDAVTRGIARPAFLGQPPIGRVFICPREGLANGSKRRHLQVSIAASVSNQTTSTVTSAVATERLHATG